MINVKHIALAPLFEPFALGSIALANRLVMAPMSRNRADHRDAPHALTVRYYAQRATAGLIVTEAAPITSSARASTGAPGIYSDAQIAGWRRVTAAVHAANGRIFLQLWHAGRISSPHLQPDGAPPVAPSAVPAEGFLPGAAGPEPFVTPRALGLDEIAALIGQFALAARNARRAEFDGVEIHAANGYLVDQFLRDGSNYRSDAYGGPADRRRRFLAEILDATIAVWGEGRVGVRLSPASSHNSMSDSDPEATFGAAAAALNDWPLAYLHVDETANIPFDWTKFRRNYRGVYMANSGYDAAKAATAVAQGHADLIGLGVLFLANPDLVARLRWGAELNVPDRKTFYGGDHRGYTDYPSLDGIDPTPPH